MPLNPVENMPATLIRNVAVNKLFENFNELKIKFSPNENLDNTDGPYNSTSSHQISNLLKQVKVSSLSNLNFVISYNWFNV